ncbi:hypothetical protein TcCL_NonESM07284 [Trypanosoma cruzi]|uniref:Uncharacterized protein n=1 Tax=Trypanosoma cruzi (strain CL Brener) TaxID=353153 RepID=Q4DHB7_TRYCC|nr:hypothetical protein Tc00.1047053511153.80 [Trypanosoma cruzi]EAN91913.1 hypothetical protein Tc00.1047053511153.80 [Trypanosoma cruzi]RNC43072.1 hypothetical protein TcCL_NonESM07284 [Trypanosoma cruzi]|eukprot:XP_813764.1 hypothetical protein [Trypanosoma cruzi strain CL Brener]
MARHGWISPHSFTSGRGSAATRGREGGGGGGGSSPVLGDYYCAPEGGDDESSIFDDEILMMTDAEKEAFAELQSRLEEECLSQFYYHHHSSPSEGSGAVEGVKGGGGGGGRFHYDALHRNASGASIRIDGSQPVSSARLRHCRSRSSSAGNRSPLAYPSARRSREREAWYRNQLEEELTFRPQINSTEVAARYMEASSRRSRELNAVDDAAETSQFRPVTNRLRTSSLSDHLSRYLRTPVHLRLGRTASASSQRRGRQQLEKKPRECGGVQRSRKDRQLTEAFLRRLEETNQRRERNLQRIAVMHNTELTFRPKLAPGTCRRKTPSVVAPRTREEASGGKTQLRHTSVGSGDPETEVSFPTASVRPSPHINSRSRIMKRSLNDLRLFELRRQQRLEQLRAEHEAMERQAVSGKPAVSIGSRRLTETIFGGGVTHEIIQQYLQRNAWKRAAAIRAEYEARQREEESQLTFHPEVHPAPPHVHEIAQELALNKSLTVKKSTPKPIFRFS